MKLPRLRSFTPVVKLLLHLSPYKLCGNDSTSILFKPFSSTRFPACGCCGHTHDVFCCARIQQDQNVAQFDNKQTFNLSPVEKEEEAYIVCTANSRLLREISHDVVSLPVCRKRLKQPTNNRFPLKTKKGSRKWG